jgi:hypothetical protein
MVVGRVGAHTAHYVSADRRWLVAGPPALQLINDVLRSKGFAACPTPDSWKDREDLVTSSHEQSLHLGWVGFHSPHIAGGRCRSPASSNAISDRTDILVTSRHFVATDDVSSGACG